MRRYAVVRPRAVWFEVYGDEAPVVQSLTVDGAEPRPIGILDPDGNDIVRMPDPIGFVWFEDR